MIQLPQYVDIQSNYLSILYKLITLSIIILQFSSSIYHKKYLLIDNQPTSHFFSTLENYSGQPFSTEDKNYCKQFQCQIQDSMSLITSDHGNSFIKTHSVKKTEKLICLKNSILCDKQIWEKLSQQKIYTVMPEFFSINMEHSLGKSQIYDMEFSSSNRLMRGKLLFQNGSTAKQFSNEEKWDSLEISLLLQAAGIDSLDQESDMGLDELSYFQDFQLTKEDLKHKTYRQTGVLLELRVHYSNIGKNWFGVGQIEYQYTVHKIPNRSIRKKYVQEFDEGAFRFNIRDYGIRIDIIQTAQIGKSSFSSFLTNIVTPTVTLTGIVYTILYYIVAFDPKFVKQKEFMILKQKEQ